MSQPAMSETLARLRQIFNDPLLVRTGRGMVPTARAIDAAQKAKEAIRLVERAISGREDASPRSAELEIRMVAHESISFMLVPKLMKRLQHEAPGARVIARSADVRLARELLEADECELVVGYPPTVALNLHASTLLRLRLCCIVRTGHPGISGRLTMSQYLEYPHVVLGALPNPVSTIETEVENYLRNRHLSRRIGARVSDMLLSPAIVSETDFIAIVSERVARVFADSLNLQMLPPPMPLEDSRILMIWHERTHRDARYRWIRHVIRGLAI